MKRWIRPLLCLLLLLPCSALSAADFGLILDQTGDYVHNGQEGSFAYSGALIPRFSTILGDSGDFYISAGIEADYRDGWSVLPELLRTELTFTPGNAVVRLGRMNYTDPLGFIAEGLFDGLSLALDSNAGTFSVGAYYTGFLYKGRINIGMTSEEMESNATPLDYGDFADTYFAPRRAVAVLGWEHLSIGALQAKLALIGQFALSGEDRLNSQYAVGAISLSGSSLAFNLGGAFELMQDSGVSGMAFAGETGLAWMPQSSFGQRLSFLARYSSGNSSGQINAFAPLTTEAQGNVLKPKLSGVSLLSLDYLARLHQTFSLNLSSTYYIRTDLGTYRYYPVMSSDSTGHFLGNEFYARLLWSPVSDLQLSMGGGVFLPSLGDVAPDNEKAWRVELNAVFSLF